MAGLMRRDPSVARAWEQPVKVGLLTAIIKTSVGHL